jgi:tetrapyrrole methylase family protein/MazG family protein
LSFIEPVLTETEADALDGLHIADATALVGCYVPPFDGERPVLLAQLHSRMLASEVKLVLMELYPADHPVTLLNGAGTRQARVVTMPLYQMDQQSDFAYLTTLWLPPLERPASLPTFHNIIAHLRSPEGCPWDQEQDHLSLRNAIIEEAYEAADAIDHDAMGDLRDELGDLLLLITMHAQMASESGDFNLSDVIASISEKMIRRHPHVFGERVVSGSAEVVRNWEQIKSEERAARDEPEKDTYDEVALALPALLRAEKLAKRARKQGWQPPDAAGLFARWQENPNDPAALGDLLLALTSHAGAHDTSAEDALRESTARLITTMREQAHES